MVCTERRAQQESVHPGLTSVSLMRIRGVSVRMKSEEVRIGRFRQQTVLRVEQVHHSRASSAAGSSKPQSLTETMGFKPDNKVRCRLSSLQSCNFTEKMNISNFPSCWSGDPVSLLPLLRFPWMTMRILKAALCELNYRTFKFTWIDDFIFKAQSLTL